MGKRGISIVIIGVATALVVTGCSSDKKKDNNTAAPPAGGTSAASSSASGGAVDGKGAKVGIILPDTTTSPRWVTADPTALKAACTTANLTCDIQNAGGSAAKMKTIAQQMESSGIKALMIVDLDAASGAAILQAAKKAGVITVDYDRLTPGGGAALYVSFDGVKVGEVQGKALTECPQVKDETAVEYVDIDGAPTDNNATLFAQGYDSVLSKQTGWKQVGKQTGNWDGPTAGRVFNSMLGGHPNIKAVMAANDTMAGAVITDLKRQHLNGKVAVGGQDATAPGLQAVLAGDQCFTIYKDSKLEAIPAVNAIAQLVNGEAPDTKGVTVTDPETKQPVPAILATPVAITKENVAVPINDQYTPKDTVCTGTYAAMCTAAGVK
jgi:D-xylose transport system substrate-binding protein